VGASGLVRSDPLPTHDLMFVRPWLAAHVGGAIPHLRPEHGHLSLVVGQIGEILDVLTDPPA